MTKIQRINKLRLPSKYLSLVKTKLVAKQLTVPSDSLIYKVRSKKIFHHDVHTALKEVEADYLDFLCSRNSPL